MSTDRLALIAATARKQEPAPVRQVPRQRRPSSQALTAAGMCVRCSTRLGANEKRLCSTCRDRKNAQTRAWRAKVGKEKLSAMRKEYEQARKAAGLCLRCNTAVVPERVYCRHHLEWNSTSKRNDRRARRVLTGTAIGL